MIPTTKEILRDFSLLRFYVILILTVSYFLLELITAHLTHSLILQIDAYRMLYNILSLITCIVTVKLCQKGPSWQNTFGWTRLHVCGVVSNICFLAALGFSVTVEAIQTMIHADHHDSMHGALSVAIVGASGILVNMICFFTIGGYTFHQSSFLDSHQQHHIGDDFVISASVQAYVQDGMKSRRRQGSLAVFRDMFGSVLVLIVSGVVFYFELGFSEKYIEEVKFVDPICTIAAVVMLASLSYRLAKDAGHILLLTIPNHINVKVLLHELKASFPELYDVHDFHVWQLTSDRIVASAHVVLQTTENYLATQYNLVDFLRAKGISHITLQPEFLQLNTSDGSPCVRKQNCFLPCQEDCELKQCCTAETHAHCKTHQEPISEFSDFSSTVEDVPLVQFNAMRLTRNESVSDEDELQPMI